MREHASWCASRYSNDHTPPQACDCGAEQENAAVLAPFTPLKKRKGKLIWAGKLPAQFCLKCEGSRVKRYDVVFTPIDKPPEPRTFAVCLDCLEVREVVVAE